MRVSASEVNPPQTLADLVERAHVIVEGTITSVEHGPSTKASEGPIQGTAVLNVHRNGIVKGFLTSDDVKIVVAASSPISPAVKPPNTQMMFFLESATQTGYLTCVAMAGLIEDGPGGLVTPLDPTQSTIVSVGISSPPESFDQLVDAVETLVK